MAFYTYLLASAPHGTLYCGHTDNIAKRVWQHKEKFNKGFTAKYDVVRLVWFQSFDTREAAKSRERKIKAWKRDWKIRLIEEHNRDWRDLYPELMNL